MDPTIPNRRPAGSLGRALLIGVLLILGIVLFIAGVVWGSHWQYRDGTREYIYPMGEAMWLPLQRHLASCACVSFSALACVSR